MVGFFFACGCVHNVKPIRDLYRVRDRGAKAIKVYGKRGMKTNAYPTIPVYPFSTTTSTHLQPACNGRLISIKGHVHVVTRGRPADSGSRRHAVLGFQNFTKRNRNASRRTSRVSRHARLENTSIQILITRYRVIILRRTHISRKERRNNNNVKNHARVRPFPRHRLHYAF